jgi:hypothetical protein
MRLVSLLVAVPLVWAACQAPERKAVAPQRPTVSFDTTTTAPKTFEVEAGVLVDPGDRVDTPTLWKYGASESTELDLGWSPYQYVDLPGRDVDGGGDVVLGVRQRLWDADGELPAGAVFFTGKLPTASAASGLGSGEVDLRVAGILNRQFGAVNTNLFYQYGALGRPGGVGTASEHTITLTGGVAIDDRWGAFCEFGGIFVPSARTDNVFTIVGATYAAQQWLVLDAGFVVGLSDDAPDLQAFVGFTCNFGRPFGGG